MNCMNYKFKSVRSGIVLFTAFLMAVFTFTFFSCNQDEVSEIINDESNEKFEDFSDNENQQNESLGESEKDNSKVEESFKPYVIEGFYQKDTDPCDDSLTVASESLTDFKGAVYTIIDYKVWTKNKNDELPLRVAYLVTDGDKNYLCSVWYFLNNGKDYVKWNPPLESSLKACPEKYDYTDENCKTSALSKELKKDLTWTVTYKNKNDNQDLIIEKVSGKKPSVTYGNLKWNVNFSSVVKNFSLSMPSSEERMEMEVDEGLWWASSKNSPKLIHEGKASIEIPLIAPFTLLYELQCCKSYGMYLLSLTKANYNYDDYDDYEYIDYSVIANFILNESDYNQLMIHFR